MKAIPIMSAGDASSLKIRSWREPKINDDEVLIKNEAFGINFADIMARKGVYNDAPPMPFVPGYESAGIITETGKNVSEFKVGDKVLAVLDFGGYAEYSVANKMMCFKIPEDMSFTDAASIPVNFSTAYHAIHNTGLVLPGSKVLIHAAAGGVGLSAIQLAKLAECEIFGTAGSDKKLDLIREWGVEHPINYTQDDFVEKVKEITNGEGVDIILDSIGGSYIKKGISILRPHGRLVAFGVSSISDRDKLSNILKVLPEVASMVTLNSITMLKGSKGIYGVNMKALGDRPEVIKYSMDKVMELFAQKKIKTVVSKVYDWSEIAQAHEELESRRSTGKIIMKVS